MKKEKIYRIIAVIFIFLSFFLFFYAYYYYREFGRLSNITEKLKELEDKDKNYTLREQRQQTMTKTLMIVYGLSKWEAHYYSIIFDDFSRKFDIPWEIYPAIIRVESNFKCTVVSSKGAKGIMQILETTGEIISKEIGINYIKGETLWNDLCNLIIGCYYLSIYINEKGLDSGVQSYLGGPAYLKSAKSNADVFKYLGEYKTTVGKEYKILSYMYRGIVAELGYDYNLLHSSSYSDSIIIDTELFK